MKVIIVVSIVVFGILLVYLISTKSNIFSAGKSINLAGNIVYSGTYKNENEIGDILKKYETFYYENLRDNKKTFIVYGNKYGINVASFEEIHQGDINLLSGGQRQTLVLKEHEYYLRKISPTENKVRVIIEGNEYNFDLAEGENVYYVIAEEKNE